jgi:hypothetical protein
MNTTFPQKRALAPSEVGLSADDLAGLRIAQQAVLSGSLRSPGQRARPLTIGRMVYARVLNTLQGLSRDSIQSQIYAGRYRKGSSAPTKTRHKSRVAGTVSCQLSAVEIAELVGENPSPRRH